MSNLRFAPVLDFLALSRATAATTARIERTTALWRWRVAGNYCPRILRLPMAFFGFALLFCNGASAADAGTAWRPFSQVGNWSIIKGPAGCAAETRTLNDLLAFRISKNRGYVSLVNEAMDIPPGRYPVGFKLGPPNDFDGTVQAVVVPGTRNAVHLVFAQKDFLKIAGAGWVELTLGSHKHFVNTGSGIDVVRALKVCEASTVDPFRQAGGGILP